MNKKPNPGTEEAIEQGCKPVRNYEDRYEVSKDGHVFSLKWEGGKKRKELTQHIVKGRGNKVGYLVVRLHKDKKTNPVTVGRLVLEAFVGVESGKEVNHKDGNTLNNNLDNLEWVTRSENQKHAIKNGLAKAPVSPNPKDSGKKYYWVKGAISRWATPSSLGREFGLDIPYLFKMASNEPHYLTFKGWSIKPVPNPGTQAAQDISCFCPVIDNHYGQGILLKGEREFWYNDDCKIHGGVFKTKK